MMARRWYERGRGGGGGFAAQTDRRGHDLAAAGGVRVAAQRDHLTRVVPLRQHADHVAAALVHHQNAAHVMPASPPPPAGQSVVGPGRCPRRRRCCMLLTEQAAGAAVTHWAMVRTADTTALSSSVVYAPSALRGYGAARGRRNRSTMPAVTCQERRDDGECGRVGVCRGCCCPATEERLAGFRVMVELK